MTLLYCCPSADVEGEGAEHSATCPERRAAEITAERASVTEPAVRRAQVWAGRAESYRRFLVTTVADGKVRGMSYLENDSATYTKTHRLPEFLAAYVLLEDVPAHWEVTQ
ncbi:hypothetical protein FHR32_005086 [Streptosporangium album]|uniref:Uncharacterized protein n=1 Tax=Streptosporangium album TaxID=47479 RepID=A0A7W7WBZ1_9ACTN|nr:hypothetical protein [Streptosporangium album]MBB4940709.1 hypothetical protein [Streptosporangium album]